MIPFRFAVALVLSSVFLLTGCTSLQAPPPSTQPLSEAELIELKAQRLAQAEGEIRFGVGVGTTFATLLIEDNDERADFCKRHGCHRACVCGR